LGMFTIHTSETTYFKKLYSREILNHTVTNWGFLQFTQV